MFVKSFTLGLFATELMLACGKGSSVSCLILYIYSLYISLTVKVHILSYVFEAGIFKSVTTIEVFLQSQVLHRFLISNVIPEAIKTCISAENFTTISFYVQLMLKNIIMLNYPLFWAVHRFFRNFWDLLITLWKKK